jgi:6-phosphogluconolactonase (cycloisomerase 2 family)
MPKAFFYQAIGPTLTRHDIDVDGAALTKREAVTIPGANVQYVWPHPSKQWLYVVASNGGPGVIPGTRHIGMAFRIDPSSGALTPHGEPVALPSRPVHCSVDRAGQYLLTAYVSPSNATVHRINADGTLGQSVPPRETLDTGIFAHQILTAPGNKTAIMVTRGHNAEPDKPEEPGALKVYGFDNGVLSNIASIARGNGIGFGPRHFDIHPNNEWLYLSVERQSELHVYKLNADGTLPREPMFIANALIDRKSHTHTQMAGPIHVHPNGRFVTMTNRNSGTEEIGGKKVFKGGENNIATFSIAANTGEPTLIQHVESQTNHLRTFAIDPSGKLLIAASIQPMAMRDGTTLPAALVLHRIGDDGRLTFARKYDVDTGRFLQFWTGIVTLP